jgi:hypothetical protein
VRICKLGHHRQIPGALKHSTASSLLLFQRELRSSGEFKQIEHYQTHLYTWHTKTHNWTDYPPLQCDQTWKFIPGRALFWLGTHCTIYSTFSILVFGQQNLMTIASMRCQHWHSISKKNLHLQTVRSERCEKFSDRGREESKCIFGFSGAQKGKIPRSEHW